MESVPLPAPGSYPQPLGSVHHSGLPACFVLPPSQSHNPAPRTAGSLFTSCQKRHMNKQSRNLARTHPSLRPAADAKQPAQQRAPARSQKRLAEKHTARSPAATALSGASNTPRSRELEAFKQAPSLCNGSSPQDAEGNVQAGGGPNKFRTLLQASA